MGIFNSAHGGVCGMCDGAWKLHVQQNTRDLVARGKGQAGMIHKIDVIWLSVAVVAASVAFGFTARYTKDCHVD